MIGLEELPDLKVVAQMLRVRGHLDHVHREAGELAVDGAERGGLTIVVIGNDHPCRVKLP